MSETQKDTKPETIGFVFINKPAGITSRDCVNRLQRMLPPKTKIGHAGTLDTFATGLLIIGIGRPATKLFTHLIKLDKRYWMRAKMGEQTDTLDYTGNVISSSEEDQVSLDCLTQAVAALVGAYEQTPPLFSALKWQGKRLSDMARSKHWGKEVLDTILQTKKKSVHIYALELLSYSGNFMTLEAHVSHGTYIRSLANDIAQHCDSVATTYELKRLNVGPFSLEQATPLDDINNIHDINAHLVPVEALLETYQAYISQNPYNATE